MLVGVIGSSELGTPERLTKLENMKQKKTDHGETLVTYISTGDSIMAYGSTPYVGMNPQNDGHNKSAQMTHSKCLR